MRRPRALQHVLCAPVHQRTRCFVAVVTLHALALLAGDGRAQGDVMGPVVQHTDDTSVLAWFKHTDVETDTHTAANPGDGDTGAADDGKAPGKATIAEYLNKQLENEFRNEEAAQQSKTDLSETLTKEKGSTLEQVVKVSSKKKHNATEAANGTVADAHAGKSWDADPTGSVEVEEGEGEKSEAVEQDVDRLIDAESNEYVLSKSKSGVALTLDPLLIQDLTVVLTASALLGSVFEALKQPVINGYIIAGSLVGPDGLALVKELVQVESLAQVGVQLLLFGLGMEFSVEKLREVGAVAILGGFLQIVLFIVICAVGAVAIGGAVLEGIFVGALVSMSSTSVVIKSLGSARNAVTQIVIGTLILQDCTVGLMFALMPVLSSLAAPDSSLDPEATGEIVLLILKVLLKLAGTLLVVWLLARSLVPRAVAFVRANCSDELFQICICGYCLSCAWVCGRLGISHELGAFLAGIMISPMEQHEEVLHTTEQVRNLFTGLFLASIGLVISPVFIFEHFRVLSLGAALLIVVKGLLIALVVWNFRFSWNISVCVGLSLAQVGEFAFVLLSLASQLSLVSHRLAMLILGVTAMSLLATPLVLSLTHRYLPLDDHGPLLEPSDCGRRKGGGLAVVTTNGKGAHGEARVRPARAPRAGNAAGEGVTFGTRSPARMRRPSASGHSSCGATSSLPDGIAVTDASPGEESAGAGRLVEVLSIDEDLANLDGQPASPLLEYDAYPHLSMRDFGAKGAPARSHSSGHLSRLAACHGGQASWR